MHGSSEIPSHSLQPVSDETLGSYDSQSPGSPPMKKIKPTFSVSPSPPPQLSRPPIIFDHPDSPGPDITDAHRTGDAQLISSLDNNRDFQISKNADTIALPPINSRLFHDTDRHRQITPEYEAPYGQRRLSSERGAEQRATQMKGESLKGWALDALRKAEISTGSSSDQGLSQQPTVGIEQSAGNLTISEESSPPREIIHSQQASSYLSKLNPPSAHLPPSLPPLGAPGAEPSGQTLPSIRLYLTPSERENSPAYQHGQAISSASSPGRQRLPSMSVSVGHGSPPISPPESFTKSIPSPCTMPQASPQIGYNHGFGFGHTTDYPSNSVNTDSGNGSLSSSAHTPDVMSIPGITHAFQCVVDGCKARPFQTQYLLNSHQNVHSQDRPHYCPVPGCARGEGGKGFKRKNEMLRHGLVHESPGYVCPFCPEKDHKYPRPDNLQRHVRVHHPDRSKDDPRLRDVLAQRADGPSRGRRRRGGA